MGGKTNLNKKNIVLVAVLALTTMACKPEHQTKILPACSDDPARFEFVHISDVHIGYGRNDGRLAEMVAKINEINPAFVINTGDISDHAGFDLSVGETEWKQYFNIIAPLAVPMYNVPGNHDLGYDDRGTGVLNFSSYDAEFGARDQDFEYGGIQFIILNDIPHESKSWTQFTSAQLDHVKTMLSNGKPTFIAAHIPLLYYGTGEPNGSGADQMMDLMKQHPNALGFISGHLHKLIYYRRDGIIHIAGPDLKEDGHYSYLRYKVRDDAIEVCTASLRSDESKQISVINLNGQQVDQRLQAAQ